VTTAEQTSVDWLSLEYVETAAGDVYAQALVTQRGEVVRVVEVDTGADVELTAAELERVTAECRARREDEVR
jgi:hypothetical protein